MRLLTRTLPWLAVSAALCWSLREFLMLQRWRLRDWWLRHAD